MLMRILRKLALALIIMAFGALGVASMPIVLCALLLFVAGFITLVLIAGFLILIGAL